MKLLHFSFLVPIFNLSSRVELGEETGKATKKQKIRNQVATIVPEQPNLPLTSAQSAVESTPTTASSVEVMGVTATSARNPHVNSTFGCLGTTVATWAPQWRQQIWNDMMRLGW